MLLRVLHSNNHLKREEMSGEDLVSVRIFSILRGLKMPGLSKDIRLVMWGEDAWSQ